MSLSGVIDEQETHNAKAATERLVHGCDLCHEREGEQFTDYYWVCELCRADYFARLAREVYGMVVHIIGALVLCVLAEAA